jgi:hypothetical protein
MSEARHKDKHPERWVYKPVEFGEFQISRSGTVYERINGGLRVVKGSRRDDVLKRFKESLKPA